MTRLPSFSRSASVGHDDKFPGRNVPHDIVDRVELKWFGRFRDHGPLSYARRGCCPGAGWLA
jgi:hypothetical protein